MPNTTKTRDRWAGDWYGKRTPWTGTRTSGCRCSMVGGCWGNLCSADTDDEPRSLETWHCDLCGAVTSVDDRRCSLGHARTTADILGECDSDGWGSAPGTRTRRVRTY